MYESFEEKRVLRITHGAPERSGNPGVSATPIDEYIGNCIFEIGEALDCNSVGPIATASAEAAVLRSAVAERWTRHVRKESRRPAVRVERGAEFHVSGGTIGIVLHIIFARPCELHGSAGNCFGDFDRLANVIDSAATAESTAHVQDRKSVV